ncbi:hypothetical protein BDZ89DRAFT_1137389 [Hymenopellis radicata]|nr:hypothetical protein BDZ89DRAFT_1137389 [Hymenopellis radicata]
MFSTPKTLQAPLKQFMEAGAPIIEDYALHTEDQDMTLCVSVHEKLHKLSELKEVLDYAQAVFDVVQVHRWIYDHAKILHRDISEGNIMWHIRDGRTASRYRYMAQDQHDPATRPPPLYRHELESFLYVLLILTGTNILLEQPTIDAITKEKCYLAPDPESPYRSWLPRSHEFLYHAKRELRKAGRPYAHPSFDVLTEFIHDLQKHLWRGMVAKSEHRERHLYRRTFDESTLGGHWTYANFLKVFDNTGFVRMYPVALHDTV